MTYKLLFIKSSKKEWDKLNPSIKEQFKKKLIERLDHPHIPKDKLKGLENCYKIKLRTVGYRLVYQVIEEQIIIKVISVGKRDKLDVYVKAHKRTA